MKLMNQSRLILYVFIFISNISFGQNYSELYSKALKAYFNKNDSQAQVLFTKVINKEPNNVEAYYYKSKLYFFAKENDNALFFINKAIEIAPTKSKLYEHRAVVKYFMKDVRSSLTDVESCIKYDNENRYVYLVQGKCYYVLDKFDSAVTAIEKGLVYYDLNKKKEYYSTSYKYRLGMSYMKLGKYEKAIQLFSGIEDGTYKCRSVFHRGVIYYNTNQKDLAKKDFDFTEVCAEKEYNKLNNNSWFFPINKAYLGKKQEAIDLINKKITEDKNNKKKLSLNYYNAACMYSVLGNIDSSLVYLLKAIDNGYQRKGWLETDLDLKNIRENSEYKLLIEKIKPSEFYLNNEEEQ